MTVSISILSIIRVLKKKIFIIYVIIKHIYEMYVFLYKKNMNRAKLLVRLID